MTNRFRIPLIAGTIFGVAWLIGSQTGNDSPTSKAVIENPVTPVVEHQVAPQDKRATEKPAPSTEPASQNTPAIVLTDIEMQAAKEFETRARDYMTLHQKLVATLPPLSETDATPEQMDQHKRALFALVQTARKSAKQGDFFAPDMVSLVTRALAATLDGKDGNSIKASITDDTPLAPNLKVNDSYPEGAPMSSMPMELLATLPKLGEALEYRFIGKRLVLVDAPAQLVLDLTPDVLR
jgi:hypothetical protein